ncbi:MAG: DNA mismatch repair endonuclease MutL, partial [Clostridiales bacterium]|nr:DNA mismatch repair endonuclease MutL [Clostridiales bacterium]
MSIIRVLDKEVYNKIAAGEVVERPASVVKELLENSVDAGADMISVDIASGGIDRIAVTDNGCGMEPEDLKAAFLPHATSKLNSADDLFNLSTLGFRGEALPSIAAVSKLTAVSRQKNNENGAKYSINCGISEYFEDFYSSVGTSVTVEDLFCNVPARAKFLKTPRGEEAEVSALVAKIILANPMIAIKYTANGRTVFHSAGQGLKSALFAVYGGDTAESVLPVNSEYKGIRVSGFVGKPDFSRPNRTYGALIVNGRTVVNYAVAKAVLDCYEGRLMKHQFPFYVLNLELNRASVDVNVHPNKLEVRFSDFGALRGAIMKAVGDALYSDRSVIGIRERETAPAPPESNFNSIPKNADFKNTLRQTQLPRGPAFERGGADAALKRDGNKVYEYYADSVRTGVLSENNNGLLNKILQYSENSRRIGEAETAPEEGRERARKENETREPQPFVDKTPSHKVAGKAFDTYIFVENGNDLFIIDQHAAHERLLYDQFMAEAAGKTLAVQRLLVPYTFHCNAADGVFIEENAELLLSLGFEVSRFSTDTYRIDSVPAVLSDMELRIFADALLKGDSLKMKSVDLLRERIAKAACRSAVKGG